MRSRIFNKMTAREVEDYLARGGNTIFVGVGVVEVHGALPIDCETIMPEACALEMAEQADGLAMINLPYFFPGGTIISNATVQVSVRESIDFLMTIGRSLVSQGFKKIFIVSGHGPSSLYVNAFCRDFFQETKVHVCHINLATAMRSYAPQPDENDNPMAVMNKMMYGSYKKMNQINYLPVDPNGEEEARPPYDPESPQNKLNKYLRPLGGNTSILYASPEYHGGGRPFVSEEERMQVCEEGEKLIHEMVANMHLDELKDALDTYQNYVAEVEKKYPRIDRV